MNEGCLFCAGKTPPKGARCKHCGRKGEPLGHTCHARGCHVEVPAKMFMCCAHWSMLPKEMRDAVWKHYTPGQEHRLVRPTAQYLLVTDEAIAFIARSERCPSP